MKKKTAALLLALVLVFGVAVGGTLAWLTDKTDAVKNTFTTSDIDIELKETKTDFKMVPGCDIDKDPKVTVKANSEKCWLFVKLDKSDNFDTFMTYDMADGWTELTGETGVYYRVVDASTSDTSFDVLKDNKVTVRSDVTKAQMNGLTTDTYPTLTVTAYASQWANGSSNFDAAAAWANVNPSGT